MTYKNRFKFSIEIFQSLIHLVTTDWKVMYKIKKYILKYARIKLAGRFN